MLGILLIFFFSYRRSGGSRIRGPYDESIPVGLSARFAGSVLSHGFLPALSIVLVTMGTWALGMRGMMITIAGEDYVTLADAKGLPPRRVFWSYGVRNAVLPQVTSLGLPSGRSPAGSSSSRQCSTIQGSEAFCSVPSANDYTLIQGVSFYLIVGVAWPS